MYIYADMVFMINLIMNSIILLLTAWSAGINYKLWRIMIAATLGSCYVLVGLLPGMIMAHYVLVKAIVSLLLILLAFDFRSVRTVLLLLSFFYMIAFIIGGAVAGWLYFWQTNYYLGRYDLVIANLSWTHLLVGSSIGIFLIVISLRRMLSRMSCYTNLHKVRIEYGGRIVELIGMLDTGNGLYTVIGRKPVVLVNQYAIEPILSEQVVAFLKSNNPDVWLANLEKCKDSAWLSRIQVIPYHGIGSNSMLLAFRPDGFRVSSTVGYIDTIDVVVGIYSGTLSKDGTYAVLLHPRVMNELSKKEGVSICA